VKLYHAKITINLIFARVAETQVIREKLSSWDFSGYIRELCSKNCILRT